MIQTTAAHPAQDTHLALGRLYTRRHGTRGVRAFDQEGLA
jgi:hypothetical protein